LSASIAEQHNKRDLDELKEKQNEAKAALADLAKKRTVIKEY